MWCLVSKLCLTPCDPMDCSLQGSSAHGIFQARILEWIAISCSRGSSWSRDQTCVASITYIVGRFLPAEPLGKPIYVCNYLFFWGKYINKLKKEGFSLGYFQMDLKLIYLCQASICSSVFSGHNKDLEWQTLKPSACHSSRVLDWPCYSSQVTDRQCYSS